MTARSSASYQDALFVRQSSRFQPPEVDRGGSSSIVITAAAWTWWMKALCELRPSFFYAFYVLRLDQLELCLAGRKEAGKEKMASDATTGLFLPSSRPFDPHLPLAFAPAAGCILPPLHFSRVALRSIVSTGLTSLVRNFYRRISFAILNVSRILLDIFSREISNSLASSMPKYFVAMINAAW